MCPNESHTYDVDGKNRFVSAESDGKESIILENVTDIFDGIIDENGISHFAIQSAEGGLIYLKFDGTEWKKYEIFRSKSRSAAISSLKLVGGMHHLCAFYSMEHGGKILLVKHCFSAEHPYMKPEVVDVLDGRRDYCICANRSRARLFYRDYDGHHREKSFDTDFNELGTEPGKLEDEIYRLRAIEANGRILTVHTSPRKGYTALIFSDYPLCKNSKIITFGIPKNCIPHICAENDDIFIQWEEDGRIMQSVSHNGGAAFTKPAALSEKHTFARIRFKTYGVCRHIEECAVAENEISVKSIADNCILNSNVKERNNKMKNDNTYHDFENTAFFIQKLADIENHVANMGKQLEEMCTFLDRLAEFKKETGKADVYTRPISELQSEKNDALSGSDIGEKDENNIKLFESMSIADK